ncbi:D-alanyl-D-alanine carboxypeptidase [Streptomyces bottropensis]|uniref:D-alanyl-D-alanine carboxypeptidase n=1 Tax=Streptomyces bottropensis TaxID=42235 RepID=UPI0037B4E448
MAGTSPDRSQRYESSTESTSGNEPPLRDAPGPAKPSLDPRLAMSRDPAPKPDQATAVFSRRALLEAEDTDLDGAGVGSGSGSGSGSAESAGRGAVGGAESEMDGPEAGSGSGADGPDGAGADAGSGAGGPEAGDSDGDASDDGSDAELSEAGTDDAGSDADSGDGEDAGDAVTGPDGHGRSAERASGGKPGAGAADAAEESQGAALGQRQEETPGSKPVTGADEGGRGTDRTESADTVPAAGDDDADRRDSDAAAPTPTTSAVRLPAARAGEETDSEAAAGTDADADTGSEAGTEAKADADAGTKTSRSGDDPKTTTLRVESDGGSAPGAAAGARTGSATADAAVSAADVRPAPDSDRASGSVADARPTTDTRPAAAGSPKPGPADASRAADGAKHTPADGAGHPTDARPAAVAGTESDPADAPPATDSTVHLSAGGRPGAASATARAGEGAGASSDSTEAEAVEADEAVDADMDADQPHAPARPPAPAGPDAPADGRDDPANGPDGPAGKSGPDDEPTAADGGGAPQGRPADDDESRAGGAGGTSEGDGGAEAGRAVDQPTAIFRAPRPPAVDHPTTMLKLGGAATKATEPLDEPEDAVRSTDAGSAEATDGAKADARPDVTDKVKADARPDVTDKVKADAEPDSADSAKGDTEPAPAGRAKVDADDEPGSTTPPPSERTSKFVALKPLDEHAPPRPPAATPGSPAIAPAEATRTIPQVGPERTTQQPLPPKPPLDLLAELTNTPPPRQTPVRMFIRRVKIWTPLAILLVIVFAVAQSLRPLPAPTLALTADESYAFKGGKISLPWPDEGQGWMDVNGIGTMDSFGEQKPVAIGSVAKAMTAYVILKEHPMKAGEKGAKIPVDAKAETEGGYDKDGESTLNTVKEGDTLSQYDAIAAIMIPSANNIARLLARWDSNGSEEEFVKKMNAAAKDLGMKNTKYTDPSGLKETTVSTAEDQVKLGNELVKMKALTDITRLPSWKDPSGQPWSNYNRLVPYDNAIGIKTGSTTAAGGNLLFAATQEVGGETAIVVGAILGQHTPPIIDTVNAVSKTAMLAAQDGLTSDTILKKGDVVGYVDDGLGGRTPVVVTKNVSAVGWAGKTVKLELDASATIPHEAKPGTEVGSLIVGNGTGDGVEVPVALQETLTEPGFLTKLTRVS